MTRRVWKAAGLLAPAMLLIGLQLACSSDRQPPKHLILVTLDTVRADHLGLYGYPRPTSPFMDSLGRSGIVFDDVWASAPTTLPSHTSLLTALPVSRHDVLSNEGRLGPDVPTLASRFRARGCATGAFLSVGFLAHAATGFQHVDAPTYRGAPGNRKRRGVEYRGAGATLEKAGEWLPEARRAPCSLLWVHLYDAHEYYKYAHVSGVHLDAIETFARERRKTDRRFIIDMHDLRNAPRLGWNLDVIDRYDAQIAYIDSELRRFAAATHRELGKAKVLWAITADHGEGLGQHGYQSHGRYLYQESLRVPLILWQRDATWTPRRVHRFLPQLDIAPTLLDLMGWGDPEPHLGVGRSFAAAVVGDAAPTQSRFGFAARRPVGPKQREAGWGAARRVLVRDERTALVLVDGKPSAMYDLHEDPGELNNLLEANGEAPVDLLRLAEKFDGAVEEAMSRPQQEPSKETRDELRALGYL